MQREEVQEKIIHRFDRTHEFNEKINLDNLHHNIPTQRSPPKKQVKEEKKPEVLK